MRRVRDTNTESGNESLNKDLCALFGYESTSRENDVDLCSDSKENASVPDGLDGPFRRDREEEMGKRTGAEMIFLTVFY